MARKPPPDGASDDDIKRPASDPATTARLGVEDYLRLQIEQSHAEIELAVRCRSFTAIGHLRRLALEYREKLAEAEALTAARASFDSLPLDELLQRLEVIARDLPEAAFLALFAAYEERHRVEIEVVPLDEEPPASPSTSAAGAA